MSQPVTTADMIRWVQVSLTERRRRAERQLAKSWQRTTPERALRVVEVGNALLELLHTIEAQERLALEQIPLPRETQVLR